MNQKLSIFRFIALLEGISFILLLFIAMPLKYYYNRPDSVKIIGMAHGILFILYIIFLLIIHIKHNWKIRKTIWVMMASLVPFGTFYMDYNLFRKN